MRAIFFSLLLIILTPFAAVAQDRDGIIGTIGSQLDAFQVDDFDTAFSFASPMIQRLFENPENFGAMVKSGYPMVHRPSRVEYLDLTNESGRIVQKVLIEDGIGQTFVLQYEMIPSGNGWLINGVSVLQTPGMSV